MGTGEQGSARSTSSRRYVVGFDLVRLVAVVLVTTQHALSITNNDSWTTIGPINIGQLGVSLFLGVSGHLSMMSSKAPIPWLAERARRLYPPYFIVMIVSFGLTWASGYKTFSANQVVSQLLMLGLFTHRDNLVNVPTWFMSLLLVGYLSIFAVKFWRNPAGPIWIVVALVVGVNAVTGQRWPWFELSTFFLAAGLATIGTRRSLFTLLVAMAFLILAAWSTPLIYTGVVLAVIPFAGVIRRLPDALSRATQYAYEYYLVHGIMLVGLLVFLGTHPLLGICVAIVTAAASAVVLRTAIQGA